ncbi:MAG: ATPase [Candidatus Thermoplasmatota archaeon]|jgi:ATP-citrate lyase beta-subunit|nr:ATPase [Candidatus Thermoplasmatota archaeon]
MMPKYGAEGSYIEADPVQVTAETDLDKLPEEHPWLENKRLVVKPDQLFGKRGKSGLVLLDASFKEAGKFISQKMGKQAKVGKVSGILTNFIIEEFIPHKIEYYAAIKMDADGDHVLFSTKGGMNIEEVWDSIREAVIVPLGKQELDPEPLIKEIPTEERKVVGPFLKGMYQYFAKHDLTLLELNPFTIVDGKVRALDMRTMLDDTAAFQNAGVWEGVEFPSPFGREPTKEEAFIKSLDEKTGASLKLTILNPEGRVWTMVAGGGASVVYADTIVDKGFSKELANYGEYSGDPSTEETYLYARTLLSLMTKEKHKSGKDKILIIGGGIANFTDVANTFTGIIQALKEYNDKMKQVGVRIYVRRGGPNYKAGLEKMRTLGKELGLNIKVFGPEAHMTHIIPMALEEDEKGVK